MVGRVWLSTRGSQDKGHKNRDGGEDGDSDFLAA